MCVCFIDRRGVPPPPHPPPTFDENKGCLTDNISVEQFHRQLTIFVGVCTPVLTTQFQLLLPAAFFPTILVSSAKFHHGFEDIHRKRSDSLKFEQNNGCETRCVAKPNDALRDSRRRFGSARLGRGNFGLGYCIYNEAEPRIGPRFAKYGHFRHRKGSCFGAKLRIW